MGKYELSPVDSYKERLKQIYDLFKIVYADYNMNRAEQKLALKYAIALGCAEEKAKKVIKKSVRIFGGIIDFDDYQKLIDD